MLALKYYRGLSITTEKQSTPVKFMCSQDFLPSLLKIHGLQHPIQLANMNISHYVFLTEIV